MCPGGSHERTIAPCRGTREETIELALQAMTWVISEESIPRDVRREIALAHAHLHACRSTDTVARVEREQRLT